MWLLTSILLTDASILILLLKVKQMKKMSLLLLSVTLLITACSSLTVSEREIKRKQIDEMAAMAVAGLVEQDAKLQQDIDNAFGYAVANMKVTKVPIVGAGGGEGVFINNKTNKHTYFTVKRFDLGGGWGARSYKALFVLKSQKSLERMEGGTWEFQAGVEASAGTVAAEGSSGALNPDYSVHVLSDGGASATATARTIKLKVNRELTEN